MAGEIAEQRGQQNVLRQGVGKQVGHAPDFAHAWQKYQNRPGLFGQRMANAGGDMIEQVALGGSRAVSDIKPESFGLPR